MEKKIDVDEIRNRRMTDHITPEELRRVRKALMYAADRAPGNLLLRAAATIEALQAERDGLAATLEQVRALASANNRLRDSENACMVYAPSVLAIIDQTKEGTDGQSPYGAGCNE